MVSHIIHSEEHTAVNGLEAVSHVGKSTRNNYRNRIVDVGGLHFLLYVYWYNAFAFGHNVSSLV